MIRTIFAMGVAFCVYGTAWAAVDGDRATGPAAAAVRQWFTHDLSLGCANRDGRAGPCGRENGGTFQVFYGNASGGPGAPDVLVFALYLGDPTGNGEQLAIAQFRKSPNGDYRFLRRLPPMLGGGVVPGTNVIFGHGQATWMMQVLAPGDSHSMPTGQRRVSVSLQ